MTGGPIGLVPKRRYHGCYGSQGGALAVGGERIIIIISTAAATTATAATISPWRQPLCSALPSEATP